MPDPGEDPTTRDLRAATRLGADRLRRRVDPDDLGFSTTEQVEPLIGTVGQPRAMDAISLGARIESPGFNMFVVGLPGSGRETTVREFLQRAAAERPVPEDWTYVHNFAEPDHPRAISLPAGRGRELATRMEDFLTSAQQMIPRAFESDDYDQRRQELLNEVSTKHDQITNELEAFARERGFAIQGTPVGIASIAVEHGRPLQREEIERRPEAEREAIERHGQEVQRQASATLRSLRRLEKEAADRLRNLDREVLLFTVGPLIDDLREEFKEESALLEYFDQVEADLPDRLGDFRPDSATGPEAGPRLPDGLSPANPLDRYRVNVFVDNGDRSGAPVLVEHSPTYYNLIGRTGYRAAFGTLVTDFREILPGALQRANGGFLVLDAAEVLRDGFAWNALKRSLITGEARIEHLAEQLSLMPMTSLRPDAVPLDLRVVLIGTPFLYQLLHDYDEDFRELFKVRADFAPDMDWDEDNAASYAAFVSRCVAEDPGLRHFDAPAVARLIEHGARLRDDQHKLSTRLVEISDLIAEASFWAGERQHEVVGGDDVEHAIAQQDNRGKLLEERTRELITDGTIAIHTSGGRVGQLNGLAIVGRGRDAFGKPSRVSARVSVGSGSVRSIEQEIELSGPIHSKGFMILSGYLAETYGQDSPLSLAATLVFEQAYEEVEGDSASSTELYALLSALAGLPLDQGLAVTGSMDQHGEIQAVGGVTPKVEGFFDVCAATGLTGEQGVIIPAANVRHLMLRDEVIEAVERGEFHVYAIRHVDEGIELLTGTPAGERTEEGDFPEGTVHRMVRDRLQRYAETVRNFASGEDGREA
jgi:predicted ATP-dependent protease